MSHSPVHCPASPEQQTELEKWPEARVSYLHLLVVIAACETGRTRVKSPFYRV